MRTVHPIRWLREHPNAADWSMAALLTVSAVVFHFTLKGEEFSDPSLLGAVLCVGSTLPIGWRRRAPAVVLVVISLCQMSLEFMNAASSGWMGVLIAAYTLGAYRSGRVLWWLSGAIIGVVVAFVAAGVITGDAPWQALLATPIMFAAAIVLGDNLRRRRERAAELVERAERAERERLLLAHQHVQEERTRIARELHDVVAHSVSLMVIQMAAARRSLHDPAKAETVLAQAEDTGRAAMQEMRRILGVLRDEDGRPALAPQPGLLDIQALTAGAADLPISLRSEGDLGHLPTGVEVSAFRIVQEALTNVRRHAGTVHRVDVAMVRENGTLLVEVADDGRGAAAAVASAADGTGAGSDSGYGLIGMRERVAAYDGELYAGPRPGGGWRVRAVFPVGAA